MKLFKVIVVITITVVFAGCADQKEEKKSPTIQQPANKKEETKTSISISDDSVGVTTKRGDKVEISKDGAGVENKDAKVKVKKKKNQ